MKIKQQQSIKEHSVILQIAEDDAYWKEDYFSNDKDDDDDDDDDKNECLYEQCENCTECGNLPECDECIESLHEALERPVAEQNTTAAIAGYMMPLGAKRPGVTDYMEKYDLLDEPSEKEKIKNLDKGPNPDRTYNKVDWDKLGKNEKSDIANVAEVDAVKLNLKNMFEYTPMTTAEKEKQQKSKEANKSKTDTPGKDYYKKHKEEQKKKSKEYYQKNKAQLTK